MRLVLTGFTLALATGCYSETPTCGSQEGFIADDDLTVGVSPSMLLERAAQTGAIDAQLEDGSPVDVDVTVVRGEGEAYLVEQWDDMHRRWTPGQLGVTRYGIGVACDDFVAVPVEVSILGGDGLIDISAAGGLTSSRWGLASERNDLVADVEDADIVSIPDPIEHDPANFESTWYSVQIAYEGPDERGSVWWSGKQDSRNSVGAQLVHWGWD